MPTSDDNLRSQEENASGLGTGTEYPVGDREDQTTQPPDRFEQSALDQTRERLGLGYTGAGSQKSKIPSRLWKSNSKIKKRLAIAGAVAGTSAVGSILIFLAMLPLKIQQIVTTIESHYSAGIDNAMNKQADNFVSEYFRERIIPNLGKKGCKSTIDASCVSLSPGSGPFDRFYNAWAQSGFERKLANDSGMTMGYKNGSYYISYPGVNSTRLTKQEMKDFTGGKKGIFDLAEKAHITQVERKHIRSVMHYHIAQETFMKRVFLRYKVNSYLSKKFAIKRCVIACQIRDNYADKKQNLKRATWAFLIRHMVQPMSDNYGLMAQCLIGGNTCDSTLRNIKSGGSGGDLIITSGFDDELRGNLEKYAASYGTDTLETLIKDADKISEQGMSKFILSKIASKIVGQEITAEALDKALGPVGIAKTAAQIVSFINNVGPLMSKLRYATYAAAAVSVYTTYATMSDEAKSGHTNAAAMGSAADLLGPEVTDDKGHQADITATPIYGQIFNTSSSQNAASMFSLLGLVSADSTQSKYVCDDGKPVAKNEITCPEESGVGVDLAGETITNAAKKIPGWGAVAATSESFNTILTDYNPINWISDGFGHVAQYIPGVGKMSEKFMSLLNPLMGGLSALYKIGWSSHMTGGRTGTAIAAGASITQNDVCQVSLGCAAITPKQAAKIRNEQLEQDKEVFNSQSMFARIFSTNSQYSLVSRMAIAMPTNAGTFSANISSSLSNPIHTISSVFGSLLSPRNVFADTSAQKDPFTIERGYVTIPKNPHAYWEKNCVSGPLAIYDQGSDTLDVSEWVKSQKQDPDTGQAYATTSNPCLLIHTTLQSMGGMYDTSLLPKDSEDGDASASTPTTVPSGTAMQLARELLASDNVSFATIDGRNVRADYQQIAETGRQTNCGGVAISPDLLGIIVALSKNYHITLGVMNNGHHCERTYHSKGLAIDLNGVGPSGQPTKLTFHGSDFNDPLAKQFISDASKLISAAGGGRIGQRNCFGSAPTLASGVRYIDDSCTHLHVDLGGGAE